MEENDHAGDPTHLGLEEGAWLSIPQVSKGLKRSDKTVRRYIRQGRFGEGAVQTITGTYGPELRIRAEAVDAVKAGLSSAQVIPLEPYSRGLERMTEVVRQGQLEALAELQGVVQGIAEGAVQAAAEDRREVVQALGDLRNLLEAQAQEIGDLRAELREARRPWWRRILRGKGEGRDG